MADLQSITRLATLEERVRDQLLHWIKDNLPPEDQQLPSESELAKKFGVSRATIRAALSLLAAQGLIIRKHGSGTYVNRALIGLRLEIGETWEFEDIIRRNKHEPGIRFISSEIGAAKEDAEPLQVAPGDDVLRIRKIFTADGKPAIYSMDMLSLKLAKPPHDAEKIQGPIFPYLQQVYGEVPAYSVTNLYSVIAGQEIANLLAVEPSAPLLLFKDLFFNSSNAPILYANNYFTDQIHFRAIQQPLPW